MKNQEKLIKRLNRPEGIADVVLDTDTYNEIDDQFALAYLIRSENRINLKAIYAAPFSNRKAESPKIGMELSYNEIHKVLHLMEMEKYSAVTYRGADNYLTDEETPVMSEAVNDLIRRGMQYSEEQPLYVIAIGAITNIASALLAQPLLKERIVVIWLGGHALDWPDTKEFNLFQDIAAARVVFDSEVPLILLPCMGVVSSFTTTEPELNYWLKGKNKLCDYLVDVTTKQADEEEESSCWSRAIWDVAAVAWLLDERFMEERLEYCPIPEYDNHYASSRKRHFIKYVYHINRDLLFEDLFRKLIR